MQSAEQRLHRQDQDEEVHQEDRRGPQGDGSVPRGRHDDRPEGGDGNAGGARAAPLSPELYRQVLIQREEVLPWPLQHLDRAVQGDLQSLLVLQEDLLPRLRVVVADEGSSVGHRRRLAQWQLVLPKLLPQTGLLPQATVGTAGSIAAAAGAAEQEAEEEGQEEEEIGEAEEEEEGAQEGGEEAEG